MSAEPFPEHGHAGDEPEGSAALPAGEDGWDEGAQQGLYVTLPAEELTLEGFAENGRADTMRPGPLLAAILSALAGEDGKGLAGLSDDQLIGFLSGARRMESLAAWTQMAALREFAGRHPTTGPCGQPGVSEFAADEVASAFRLTWHSAADQITYACAVASRLPETFAMLAAGKIHPVHVRIIEDETSILSAADAAIADEKLAEAARSKTFGELRSAAHRLVMRLDPEAVRKRKERARRDAHVRRFREASGNAGMTAREMPSVEIFASMQHVEARALDLRAAGMTGTLEELKARAYLDLLQERDSRLTLDIPDPDPDQPGPAGAGPEGPSPQDGNGGGTGPGGSGGPARTGPGGHGRSAAKDDGPSVAALVNITIPATALEGDTGPPGEVAGFGLVDHQDARDLVAAAARNPNSRWCVTALNPDGTAAAHGCAAGPRPWAPGPDPSGRGPGPPGTTEPAELLRMLKITLNIVIRGPCNHAQAQRRYRPGRTGVRTARRPLRPGPHQPLAPGRPELPMQPGTAVQTPPSVQASPRLVARTTRTRRAEMADAGWTDLHHHAHRIPRLIRDLGSGP
jgi:hypothetical protein